MYTLHSSLRVPPKPKDPFQSRCLEHLFANYLYAEARLNVFHFQCRHVPCPALLAQTIHGLKKKTIENCLAEVSFNHLHPCDTPEKGSVVTLCICFQHSNSGCTKLDLKLQISWNFSDREHLLVVPNPPVSQNHREKTWRKNSGQLLHPKKRLLKKKRRWSYLKGASITVQMDQKIVI